VVGFGFNFQKGYGGAAFGREPIHSSPSLPGGLQKRFWNDNWQTTLIPGPHLGDVSMRNEKPAVTAETVR